MNWPTESFIYKRPKSDLETQEQDTEGDFQGIQSQLEIEPLFDTDTDEWIEDMEIEGVITDHERKPPSTSRNRKVIRHSVAQISL